MAVTGPLVVYGGVFLLASSQPPPQHQPTLFTSPHNGPRALSPVRDGGDYCSLVSERPAVPSPCSTALSWPAMVQGPV